MVAYGAKLYGALVTVVTALLTLQPEELAAATAGDIECTLSSMQASSIQAAVAPWRNASCVYNMTVESLLGAM